MLPGGLRLGLDYFGLGSSEDTITCLTPSRFLAYVLFVLIRLRRSSLHSCTHVRYARSTESACTSTTLRR